MSQPLKSRCRISAISKTSMSSRCYVKAGDSINVDDSLITLESDKASMDIPATHAGAVKAVTVKVGDKVSEGLRSS